MAKTTTSNKRDRHRPYIPFLFDAPLVSEIDPHRFDSDADILDEIRAGRVVVVKGALQYLNYFDELTQLTLDAIATNATREHAQTIQSQGFETLHRHLSGEQIFRAYSCLTASLRGPHNRLVNRFLGAILGYQGPLYIGDKVWVRFFVPHDCYLDNRRLFSTRVGHLRTQNPHRDSWSTNPDNSIVLWFAMGRIMPGNSMLIYPSYWGRPLAHPDYEQRGLRIDPRVSLGMPINFALNPGDALMFSGEHLHSSEVNVTDQTRFALTFRFTLEPPRYGEGNRWYPYRNATWLNSKFTYLADWRSRANPTYLRYLLFWRLGYWLRQCLPLGRQSTKASRQSRAATTEAPLPENKCLPNSHDLEIGQMRALDTARGIARTTEGTFIFSRYCPHEGADLTQGYLKNGRIHCAWHNLGFDLADGSSPCRGLAKLSVTRLDVS